MNGVMIQFFHWYHRGTLWNEFSEKAAYLKQLGFTAVWFPPATKCFLGKEGRGYDVYDLYDLGEFDQKGSISTRYGTKEEYLNAIEAAHEEGMGVYADIVLNHRMGGDEPENIFVQQVEEDNRIKTIEQPFEASAMTKFTFSARNGMYSDFNWDYRCFSGIDCIKKNGEEVRGIFKIINEYGTEWNPSVSHQFGNYDYLMGADVEYRNPDVVQEMKNWIKWYLESTKVDGIRLDALKHISSEFLKEWITYIKTEINSDYYILGEFWKEEAGKINYFSDEMSNLISCFDVPLHYNFFKASEEGDQYDLRQILDNSLLQQMPVFTVSFVENHDTQKLQALESTVKEWFKPVAYSIILLSEKAYPCVFYPDLFGAKYSDMKDGKEIHVEIRKVETLPKLMEARQQFGYGSQVNFFDDPNCIAFIRMGNKNNKGCLVIISNNGKACKEIIWGEEYSNAVFYDFLQQRKEEIVLDNNGKGIFTVNARSVSVWVKK
ncbi:alpha-amylase [Chryseobacterium sp. C39-AII1]|uniref:alpha-amylase n=1 Tax=Chryseobacterium sp. C39-AII1 TaxID=3080332 RepID=UPI00320A1FFD